MRTLSSHVRAIKRLYSQLTSVRLISTLTAFQEPSSVDNQVCSSHVLILTLVKQHVFGTTDRDESKDALSIIDGSTRSSERNAPTFSESVVML